MVVSLRVDDRLVHGQIVTQWVRYLKVDSVVVVNDDVADDDVQKKVMRISLNDLKSLFCTVADAARIVADPRGEKMRMLVLCKTIGDAIELVKAVPAIQDVNVGNFYRDGDVDDKSKLVITKNLKVNAEEKEQLRELVRLVPDCYHQSLSTEQKRILSKYV